ncbi:hypothetical protein N9Y48_04230 [Zobellia sp.]|nr:hypothetical protein [Zobellia sp.]
MENWYLPITIVPGLGLIILSTSNQLLSLSGEIAVLIEPCLQVDIIKRKLSQLKLLNKTLVFFYGSVALLLIAALVNAVYNQQRLSMSIGVLAVALALIGLLLLVIYSFKAVKIRQDQFKNKIG